jgi:hypothetical protein
MCNNETMVALRFLWRGSDFGEGEGYANARDGDDLLSLTWYKAGFDQGQKWASLRHQRREMKASREVER